MPLVSSLDGTQTYGWLDGLAQFSPVPPSITTPPYSEDQFPLHLKKPRSEAFEDAMVAIARSLRHPPTPLNTAFFARTNVDRLHAAIEARILDGMGLRIDRQSNWELLLVMRQVYLETAANWPDDVDQEVTRLNTLVLQICVDAVSRNITRYLTYRSKIALPVPLPNPAEMLTVPPYQTGTPAPVRDLNATYEVGMQEFARTLPPMTTTPPREINLAT